MRTRAGRPSMTANESTEPLVAGVKPAYCELEAGRRYLWRRCGRSKNQPFCDGSHKGTGLEPKEVEILERRTVAWCACKYSNKMPFCDGTHSTLM